VNNKDKAMSLLAPHNPQHCTQAGELCSFIRACDAAVELAVKKAVLLRDEPAQLPVQLVLGDDGVHALALLLLLHVLGLRVCARALGLGACAGSRSRTRRGSFARALATHAQPYSCTEDDGAA